MSQSKIAFLGLGNMGAGMCRRLLAAGHAVTVWNRTASKAAPLIENGAVWAAAPEEAVAEADIILTSLMDDASVRALFGEGGPTLAAQKPGSVHLCVTTISPSCADELAAAHAGAGSVFVSGPVLGRPDAAEAGKLVQFLAGPAEAIARLIPFCEAFAVRVIPVGTSPGAANRQKLCMNFFIAAMIEAMAETLTFSDKLGASRTIMASYFEQAFAHPGFKQYAQRLAARSYEEPGGFAMTGGYKDVSLILDEARLAACPLDLAEIIANKMQEAIAQGMGNHDWSAIQEISRQRAGLA